ncbi:MAG: Hsp20/alpha crystallin family protein, partial [Gammaproteobacteria bacterium]
GGSALTSGLGGRPLQARRLHVSSHMGPYTHYPLGRGEIMPQLDMTEDDQAFHLQVELPGMDEKDVEVTLRNHTLTIKGEKKEEKELKDKDVHRRERAYGYFRRSIEIPADVDADKITATYRKGVLTIDLPKTKQAQEQARHIEVKAA